MTHAKTSHFLQRGDEPDVYGGHQQAEDQGGSIRGLRELHLHHDGHEGNHLRGAQHSTRYQSSTFSQVSELNSQPGIRAQQSAQYQSSTDSQVPELKYTVEKEQQ